jgi:3-phenylpropionate/cinnamic acid dioxygenase small subunit
MTREEAESLLFREARLLDERRFDEWLSMFTDDCLYWIPTVDGDPEHEVSLVYDDIARMKERVYRLLETKAYAQMPPSRTQHNISNVEVLDGPDEPSARVVSNLMLVELRAGGDGQVGTGRLRLLAARCQYLFVNGPDWRIREKKLILIDRDLPHHNLSFIL